jgi:MYXO-CTERM domain-containing protein
MRVFSGSHTFFFTAEKLRSSKDSRDLGQALGSPTTAPAGDFRIELITTASLTGSTVNYFRNGSQFATGTINANGINRAFLQNLNDVKGLYGDVILTATPVPEPSSALLGLVGVLGLAIRRRRC